MQLIDVNGKGQSFSVFLRWGRVGTDIGAFTQTSPGSLQTAKSVWCEKFKEKTGNDWSDRPNFVKKPGKYWVLEQDDEDNDNSSEKENNKRDDEDESLIPSYLDPRVQKVIKLIFDTKMMSSTLVDLKVDIRKMPLGKISRKAIHRGTLLFAK